jgi:hypothetical protein
VKHGLGTPNFRHIYSVGPLPDKTANAVVHIWSGDG